MTGVDSSWVTSWTTTHGDTVEVYRALGLDGGYRYRVQAANGQVVEQGSEAYTRLAAAVEAAQRHHPVIELPEASR